MIEGLKILNFRSIKNQEIKIAPITVLYGHNSAGKSSILYSLAVLKNVILNPNQQSLGFFNLGFINLGDFQKVVFNHEEKNPIGFEIELHKDEVKINYEVIIQNSEGRFVLRTDGKLKVELKLDVKFPYPLNQEDRKEIKFDEELFTVVWNGINAQVTPVKHSPESLDKAQKVAQILNSAAEAIRSIDFIPLRRGFSKPSYGIVSQTPFLLTEEEVATYLANNAYLEGKVSAYLEEILNREFRVRSPPGTAMFYLYTVEKPTGLVTEVINDGFGVNQVIWLLAKSLRNEVSFLCIEEPEIHLHPIALRKLAHAIVKMVRKEGKRFLISTHSETFVTALLSLVAQEELKPNELCCYLVNKKEGETILEQQEVKENGQIEGGLASFMKAELEDLKAFLKAQD